MKVGGLKGLKKEILITKSNEFFIRFVIYESIWHFLQIRIN